MKESYQKQETEHAAFMGSLNPIGSNRPVQSETDAQVLHFKGLDATGKLSSFDALLCT